MPVEKPTIIFLHGFPFNHTMWDEQARLCEPRFQVMNHDLRGHGRGELGGGQYLFEFFVDDLLHLMDTQNIDKAILCGLSMGGYIALRMTERHSDRIQGLILCDTRSEADSDQAKLNRAADFRLIQKEGLPAFADRFLKKALAPSTCIKNPALAATVKQMITLNSITGVQGVLIALATRTDTTAALATFQVPTLILVGAEDPITPPAAAAALQSQIAGSRMAIIPEAAHLSNLENPQAFNVQFLDFLKQF